MTDLTTEERLAKTILDICRSTWTAVLMSTGAPLGHRMYEWMKNPQPGQLVFGNTGWLGNPPINCVGHLIRKAREPFRWPSEEGLTDEDRRQTELVWYIRTLDGRELRWTNEEFLAAPDVGWQQEENRRFDELAGRPAHAALSAAEAK